MIANPGAKRFCLYCSSCAEMIGRSSDRRTILFDRPVNRYRSIQGQNLILLSKYRRSRLFAGLRDTYIEFADFIEESDFLAGNPFRGKRPHAYPAPAEVMRHCPTGQADRRILSDCGVRYAFGMRLSRSQIEMLTTLSARLRSGRNRMIEPDDRPRVPPSALLSSMTRGDLYTMLEDARRKAEDAASVLRSLSEWCTRLDPYFERNPALSVQEALDVHTQTLRRLARNRYAHEESAP